MEEDITGSIWRGEQNEEPSKFPSGSSTFPKVLVDPKSLVNHMVPLNQSCWSLVTTEKYPRIV